MSNRTKDVAEHIWFFVNVHFYTVTIKRIIGKELKESLEKSFMQNYVYFVGLKFYKKIYSLL